MAELKVARLRTADICCPRCARMMTAVLAKDAGWVPMADTPSGYADGDEVLGYSCQRDDCLDGAFDSLREAA